MKYFAIISLLAAWPALAAQPSGFHEGPYFLLSGGILNFSADNNVRTGARVGSDFEPAVGFHFGWNITDNFAPELQVRYSTNEESNAREHVVNVNLNGVYSFIINSYFIPFVQAGGAALISAVPGDTASSDNLMSMWGGGIGFGAGIKTLFKKYGYAGILVQTDILQLKTNYQDIGATYQQITKGGWEALFGASALVGVHF